MANILIRFWLIRFVFVFVIACVGLGAAELLQDSEKGFSYYSVVGWSAVAALVAASLASYWAYKVRCKPVFKASGEDSA